MEIKELHDIFLDYPTVCTDTRSIEKDSLFFALKGANFNGNKFAKQALEKGAKYAIIDEAEYADSEQYIVVHDVLKTLQALAHFHRKHLRTPILAITGTNGKTTTKELISTVLSKQYNTLSTVGNLNNHIGVPLTLLKLRKEHEIGVIEMGASKPGDIKELAEITDPDYGIITNIGRAHIEGFGSLENIASTKKELYDYLKEKYDAKIFIDTDNKQLLEMAGELTHIGYGFENNEHENQLVKGEVLKNNPYLQFKWCIADICFDVTTHIIGTYNLKNVLAAVTVGKYFGVKSQLINEAIESYIPSNNRSQLKETKTNKLIIDAYNANPSSMKAALDNFKTIPADNKVLILGDMFELGKSSETEHQTIAELLDNNQFKQIFLVGENFQKISTSQKITFCKDAEELKEILKASPIENAYILLKGSRGVHLEDCIEFL